MVAQCGRRWGAARQGDGRCVSGAECGGRWAVMPRQPNARATGKSMPVGLSGAQAHEDSVRMAADARGQADFVGLWNLHAPIF